MKISKQIFLELFKTKYEDMTETDDEKESYLRNVVLFGDFGTDRILLHHRGRRSNKHTKRLRENIPHTKMGLR